MSGSIVVYVIVGLVVVALALGVWILDAKRNTEVEEETENAAAPDIERDPDQPHLHKRPE